MLKVGIIGGGNMGAAILHGLKGKYRLAVCEENKAKLALLRKKYNVLPLALKPLVYMSDIIILAVKPQDADGVLTEVAQVLDHKKIFVSIAAGLTTSYLERILGKGARVIRTMPNMPAQIGEGMTAICKGKYATTADVKQTQKIFDCVGETVVVQENLLDAITAVSGSGPAYVFLFAEMLMKASMSLGLSCPLSAKLLEKTLLGSIHQLTQLKEDSAVLRAKVTSKGGTTEAAMKVFFKRKTEKIFIEALKAAKKRAGQLAKK